MIYRANQKPGKPFLDIWWYLNRPYLHGGRVAWLAEVPANASYAGRANFSYISKQSVQALDRVAWLTEGTSRLEGCPLQADRVPLGTFKIHYSEARVRRPWPERSGGEYDSAVCQI